MVVLSDQGMTRERGTDLVTPVIPRHVEGAAMSQEMAPINLSAAALAREAEERELNPAQVAELRPFAQLIYKLRNVAVVDDEAAFEIAASVIDEIALADSIEAVFAANEKGPSGAEEYLENSIGAYGVQFWRSAEKFRKGTLGYYAAIRYVKFGGEKDILTVGASNVVASMFRLMELGAADAQSVSGGFEGDPDNPLWIKIHGRETPNGTLYVLQAGDAPPNF